MSTGRRPRDRGRPSDRSIVGGRRAVAEAIKGGLVLEVYIASSARTTAGMRDLMDAAHAAEVPIHTRPRHELDRMAPDHQGVAARLRPTETPDRGHDLTERGLAAFPFARDAVVVVLDGVSDPQNLGAAARCAEAAGAAVLVSRTRRAAGVTPAAVRASAGALVHLPHARVANIPRAIERLHDAEFWVVGLAGDAEATIYDEPCPTGRIAVVIGSEGDGMARLTRERCDALLSLPMFGRVASLNAASSLAATLYGYVLPTRR